MYTPSTQQKNRHAINIDVEVHLTACIHTCLLLILLSVVACSGPHQRPDDAIRAPAVIFDRLDQRMQGIEDARYLAKGDYWDGLEGRRVVGRPVIFLARPPASLRVQVNSGFGSALGALASDGANFTMLDQQQKVYYEGPATPQNLSRLLPLYLPGEDVVRVLMGGFPQAELVKDWREHTMLHWNEETGHYQMLLKRLDGDHQIIELTHPDLAVAEVRIEDDAGEVRYRYRAKGFKKIQGLPLPGQCRFELFEQSIDVRLRIERSEVNLEFDVDLFSIPAPQGIKRYRLNALGEVTAIED